MPQMTSLLFCWLNMALVFGDGSKLPTAGSMTLLRLGTPFNGRPGRKGLFMVFNGSAVVLPSQVAWFALNALLLSLQALTSPRTCIMYTVSGVLQASMPMGLRAAGA